MNDLTTAILFFFEKIKAEYSGAEKFEYFLLNKIRSEKGVDFLEQRFSFIADTINHLLKRDMFSLTDSSKDLYAYFFPDLVPTRKRTAAIFENALNNLNSFTPLFHSSEFIYRQWLLNFNHCYLVENINNELRINVHTCKETLEEYKIWVHKYPELNGSLIRSNIERELSVYPMETSIHYVSKDSSIKNHILRQLEKMKALQISRIRSKEVIEIKYLNENIVMTRKLKYQLSPTILQNWLSKFGIYISFVTAVYLIEYGMPYCGSNIGLEEILRYTNNGYGIVGLLAHRLGALTFGKQDGIIILNSTNNPLQQSVVLAFARLEQYLAPFSF